MTSRYASSSFGRLLAWGGTVVVGLWMLFASVPDDATALLLTIILAVAFIATFRHFSEDKEFITSLFLAALNVRLAFGLFIHVFDFRDFFGGDSLTYHAHGAAIVDYWNGLIDSRDSLYQWATSTTRPGWGMNYIVAAIYYVAGKNILAAQSFCAVVGAATAPMVYFCSRKIFSNENVARLSAFSIAFFPSFIIWSSQLLKDGVVIFLLVVVITMVLNLQKQFSYAAIGVLLLALFGIITVRFYIFYMVAVAVAGSFVVGLSERSTSILRRSAALVMLGLGLTYFGVIRTASTDFEKYADLERIQVSRTDLVRSAASGFNEEADISTAQGALTTIPVGFAYLMFAPFPWQMSSLRQAITLPEILVWWALVPLLVIGIVYTIRNRLRSAFPVLFFSLLLTLAYSIFQGNVGTAYRQRNQIQVFLFIFIAVGWELWREKREDRRMEQRLKQRRFEERLQAGTLVQ